MVRRLSLQDLKNFTTVTHEGASAYDYSSSHPLIHLTFGFGSALFTDGYYEKEQEQVRRFAEALAGAARVDARFPWQYGAWMRDPAAGKGNRIQGSLTPALLDALLGETPWTEEYVGKCLAHRPDDALAFFAHYRDLGLGEPSSAARRGVARALTRFDEYQLLKYARAGHELRLCDAIARVKSELAALGEAGALALAVGRYLHAPTRSRGAVLDELAAGPAPLPLASARRRLFQLTKPDVGKPEFSELVREARVSWEQVVGQFTDSVSDSGLAKRLISRVAKWKMPRLFSPSLWRLAYLPGMLWFEAVARLQAAAGELGGQVIAATQGQFTKKTGALEALDGLAGRLGSTEGAAPLLESLREAVRMRDALAPVLTKFPNLLQHLRQPRQWKRALDQLKPILSELRGLLQGRSEGSAAWSEARALAEEWWSILDQHQDWLEGLLSRFHQGSQGLASVHSWCCSAALRMKAGQEPAQEFPGVGAAGGWPEPRPHGPASLLDLQARLEKAFGKIERLIGALRDAVEAGRARRLNPDTLARNGRVWSALLDVPGLLPDMAFLRNLRNLRTAGLSMERLCESAARRRFKGVWPHQIQAGFRADPDSAPVFETIFQKMIELLPRGRHLGLGDASGSMSVYVGGIKGTTSAMDVAFTLVALMSETSGLGASFSDGTWGSSRFLSLARRRAGERALAFSMRPDMRAGMGGTQVFGAVLELIDWLRQNPDVRPPECLWFFSDMQFHPAGGALGAVPASLEAEVRALQASLTRPPLELAMMIYRKLLGPVDVVLWNLAAYSSVPVASTMKGVLLVSGFDANTLRFISEWRESGAVPAQQQTAAESQEIVLAAIRGY